MKPYKFAPYLKQTIWGGDKIAPFKGILTDKSNIGESWEISGVPGHESVAVPRGIVDDDDIGLNLVQLIDRYKENLVGGKVYQKYGNHFPLLIKFIDSCQPLSIQVHPNDELARMRHSCPGKTEMWYVIKSDHGSKITAGFNREITTEEYIRLAKAKTVDGHSPIENVLAVHESHEGDLFFLPAGRVHSIGAGNLLAEIQQTSDITYRLYDFGRLDKDGKPRELHIDEAKDAINFSLPEEYRTSYDSTKPTSELITCEYFNVHRIVVQVAVQIDYHIDSFVIVICLWGEANVNGIRIHQGETLLVPACENVLNIFGNATFLTATM